MEATVTLSLSRFKELESIEESLKNLKRDDLVLISDYSPVGCPTYYCKKSDIVMVEFIKLLKDKQSAIDDQKSFISKMRHFIERKKLEAEFRNSLT